MGTRRVGLHPGMGRQREGANHLYIFAASRIRHCILRQPKMSYLEAYTYLENSGDYKLLIYLIVSNNFFLCVSVLYNVVDVLIG